MDFHKIQWAARELAIRQLGHMGLTPKDVLYVVRSHESEASVDLAHLRQMVDPSDWVGDSIEISAKRIILKDQSDGPHVYMYKAERDI